MANNVVHTTAIRDMIADAVVDEIDAGGPGTLEIVTGADVEVATLTFSATAFGASSSGMATAAEITADDTATGHANPVDAFIIKNGTVEVLRGTVGVSGCDINLSSTTIGTNDTVSISSLTYTAPA
jgi:hypothetical protein